MRILPQSHWKNRNTRLEFQHSATNSKNASSVFSFKSVFTPIKNNCFHTHLAPTLSLSQEFHNFKNLMHCSPSTISARSFPSVCKYFFYLPSWKNKNSLDLISQASTFFFSFPQQNSLNELAITTSLISVHLQSFQYIVTKNLCCKILPYFFFCYIYFFSSILWWSHSAPHF